MPGNSHRKVAIRRKGKDNTAGSGGRSPRGLEGRGPTPKAEDRPYHAKFHAKRVASTTSSTSGGGAGPKRTGRPGAGPEWVVGRNPVLEVLQADIPVQAAYVAEGADRDDRLRDIFKLAADQGRPLLQATRNELDRMTDGAIHQGVAIRLASYTYAHLDDVIAAAFERASAQGTEPLLVALDQITDPRNLGAVVRSAAAFGAHGVIIPERRSAGMTAAAWKTSAGAAARMPIAQVTNLTRSLKACADAGFALVGLAGEADTTIESMPEASGPLVLVIGAEGTGLSRLVRDSCDRLASIPITSTVESLNAGVAAGIALYEISRSR
ncbi:MAG: 23S rRNA (guanosine(2251)-2'-O)-methyltransferase RlmB [Propionibacteriaceae bacterium]